MSSFGHIAAGLVVGRFYCGARVTSRPMLFCSAMALLPDADVLLVSMGSGEWGPWGHRGASHSLLLAVALGVLTAGVAWMRQVPSLRVGTFASLSMMTHGLIDACCKAGRGIPLMWPLSERRFHFPWQMLPDAPRGMEFISLGGLREGCMEFVYFLPMTIWALWPIVRRRVNARLTASATASAPLRSNL